MELPLEHSKWIDLEIEVGGALVTVDLGGQDYPVFEITESSAQEFAELRSASADLRIVSENCSYAAQFEAESRSAISDALIDSAIIRYRRCFTTGIRQPIPKNIVETHFAEFLRIHDYFRRLADMHIAHSVSDMETFKTVVAVDQHGSSGAKALYVGPFDIIGGPVMADVMKLGELASRINSEFVVPRAQSLEQLCVAKWMDQTPAALNVLQKLRMGPNVTSTGVSKR